MKKLTLSRTDSLTFGEGCEKYLDNCRQRNLRKGTINHYRQSYTQFFKYFDPDMPVAEFNKGMYDDFVIHLQEVLFNDVSINSYLRDLITTLHFLMGEGYVQRFKMSAIKTDKSSIKTYTDDELTRLLQKPNIHKSSFTEYQCWVAKYHKSNCEEKEILIAIDRAIKSSIELRSKKELIEGFIATINAKTDVESDWKKFILQQKEEDLTTLIAEEKLKDDETRKYIENALRDGAVKTTGTDIDKLMPPVSRFGGGNRAAKKQGVIDKIKAFFEKYFGIV